jgi:hypothetical protein
MSVRELDKLHNRLIEILDNSSRDSLDTDIQGYTVNRSAIFRSMMSSQSPFRWPDENGKSMNRREIWPLSEIVSKTLWEDLRARAALKGALKISNDNPLKHPEFKARATKNKPSIAFYEGSRTIYIYGYGDSYRALDSAFVKPMRDSIIRNHPPTHPAVVFLKPNEEWANLTNNVRADVIAANPNLSEKSIQRKVTAERKRLREEFKGSSYEGVQIGHTFGAAATSASFGLEERHDLSHQDLHKLKVLSTVPAKLEREILENIQRIIKIDTNMVFERRFNKNGVAGKIVLTYPEGAVGNVSEGGTTGTPTATLRRLFQEIRDKADVGNIEGSPSYNQLLIKYIEDTFLEKKKTSKTYRTTSKRSKSKTLNVKTRTVGSGTGVVSKAKNTKEKSNYDLRSLLLLLNSKLERQIRENMGKGNSKQVLNWRTGRFGRSAKVQDLLPSTSKSEVIAKVKYHGPPYDRFLRGGDLYRPLRDPKGIFGRSIRQILQEEKIANLRRVRVDLTHG